MLCLTIFPVSSVKEERNFWCKQKLVISWNIHKHLPIWNSAVFLSLETQGAIIWLSDKDNFSFCLQTQIYSLSTPSKQRSSECLPQTPAEESEPRLFFLPEWLWFMSFVMRDSNLVLADNNRNGAPVKGHQVWDDDDAKHASTWCLGEKLYPVVALHIG